MDLLYQWEFTMTSCSNLFGAYGEPSYRWKRVCNLKIPSKVLYFIWITCKEILPTLDSLQKRGMLYPK